MNSNLAATLLASVETNRLVLLCGAGLSFAAPSSLPSAVRLAEQCADEYQLLAPGILPADHRTDLGKLAQFFKDRHELQGTFLQKLIKWPPFMGLPNVGHDAVADLLACRGFELTATANVDTLIENAARNMGEPDFRAIVDENDVNRGLEPHAPLLKIHGCAVRSRYQTVWCTGQLGEAPISSRLDCFRNWLTPNLYQRDLLVVGFWTDWAYLNQALAEMVIGTEPRSVILVDPGDALALQQKAPDLWNWAHSGAVIFHHVQEKGEAFLDELRTRFSRQFLERLIEQARPEYTRLFGACDPTLEMLPPGLPIADLFGLRRSFCGEPITRPPRRKRPGNDQTAIGVTHIALIAKGASLTGSVYKLGGKTIRLILGAGEFLSKLKVRFADEPPTLVKTDTTIAVGAIDDGGTPSHIVRSGGTPTIVRGGIHGDWRAINRLPNDLGVL